MNGARLDKLLFPAVSEFSEFSDFRKNKAVFFYFHRYFIFKTALFKQVHRDNDTF